MAKIGETGTERLVAFPRKGDKFLKRGDLVIPRVGGIGGPGKQEKALCILLPLHEIAGFGKGFVWTIALGERSNEDFTGRVVCGIFCNGFTCECHGLVPLALGGGQRSSGSKDPGGKFSRLCRHRKQLFSLFVATDRHQIFSGSDQPEGSLLVLGINGGK